LRSRIQQVLQQGRCGAFVGDTALLDVALEAAESIDETAPELSSLRAKLGG